MFQGGASAEAAAPQYYRLTCPGGHVLRGLRTEGFQALRCPSCGAGVFVLPNSPLPEPPAPVRRAAARPAASAEPDWDEAPIPLADATQAPEAEHEDLDEIAWEDAPEEVATGPEPEPGPAPAPSPAPARRPAPRPAPADDRPVERPRPRVVTRPRTSLRDWAYRRRHRLVFLGVTVLVLLTAYSAWRRRVLEAAPRAIEIAQERGIELLEAGRFDEANALLSKGAQAADALGGAHQGAAAVRQAAAEASLLVNLSRSSLEDLIDEAGRFDPPSGWPARFQRMYAGQTVIIDAKVATPGNPPDQGPTLELRVFSGDGPRPSRSGRLDMTGMVLFQGTPTKTGDRVLFGARLESLTLGVDGEWVFRFASESGLPITHWRALLPLGWPDPGAAEGRGAGPGAPANRREGDSLRGYTDDEVQAMLGRPESAARWATQGRLVEQWLFRGLKGPQYLNFQRRPGDQRMTVTANFSGP